MVEIFDELAVRKKLTSKLRQIVSTLATYMQTVIEKKTLNDKILTNCKICQIRQYNYSPSKILCRTVQMSNPVTYAYVNILVSRHVYLIT